MSILERVVIVDDKEGIRSGIQASLEVQNDIAGYNIRVVGEADGVQNLRQLLEGGLDATVFTLDNRMPGGNGDVAAKIIRELRPTAKIIALTNDIVDWADVHLNRDDKPEVLYKTIIDF